MFLHKISLILSILLLGFHQSNAQYINFDFENWTNIVLTEDTDLSTEKDTFKIKNVTKAVPVGWIKEYSGGCVQRTTDAYSGQYAVVVHHNYNIDAGGISYYGKTEKRKKPIRLTGYYKFLEGQIKDPAKKKLGYIEVLLTKNRNGVKDTIGFASKWLPPTNTYKPFNLDIKFRNKSQPDSIKIEITSGNYWCEYFPYCSYLYIDALKLDVQKKSWFKK